MNNYDRTPKHIIQSDPQQIAKLARQISPKVYLLEEFLS